MTNSATKYRQAWNSVVTMVAVEEGGVSLTYIVKDSDGSGAWPIDRYYLDCYQWENMLIKAADHKKLEIVDK